jgi:hypothetical protein
MVTNRKSTPPPKVWWGSDPFGTSVEVQTASEYAQFLQHRRELINTHKSQSKESRALEKTLTRLRALRNGSKLHNGKLVKLVKNG